MDNVSLSTILMAMIRALLIFGGVVLTVFGTAPQQPYPRWIMFALGFLLLTIVWLL